eukprot:scaffold5009_cov172-Prasinococcus_capsulatus_cf.AAC.3
MHHSRVTAGRCQQIAAATTLVAVVCRSDGHDKDGYRSEATPAREHERGWDVTSKMAKVMDAPDLELAHLLRRGAVQAKEEEPEIVARTPKVERLQHSLPLRHVELPQSAREAS